MEGNQKERAIALLAGLGFAFSQFATNADYRDYNLSIIVRTLTEADGMNWLFVGVGVVAMLIPMLMCVIGMTSAYSALKSAGVDAEKKLYEAHMRTAIVQAALVIAVVMTAVSLKVVIGVQDIPEVQP